MNSSRTASLILIVVSNKSFVSTHYSLFVECYIYSMFPYISRIILTSKRSFIEVQYEIF
ncbi:unnamed protein product [Prunus brigantina]